MMQTITFYSYKGGVGRSLALANIATRLAEFGKQVCLLDLDLEAPGLPYKFAGALENAGIKIEKGFVDYVHRFINEGVLEDHLREYSYTWFPFPQSGVTLIPAGNPKSSTYWKKLSSIDWFELLYENKNGPALLLHLKELIRKQLNPDFLLIDSRTGISEMSGVALSLFPDSVVVMAANNGENLEGAKNILRTLKNPSGLALGKQIKTSFVLSRIPVGETPDERSKEELLRFQVHRELDDLIGEVLVIHSDRELEMQEQIKIGYDNDESVAQISKDYLRLFEHLMGGYLDKEMDRFNRIRNAEKFFKQASLETDLSEKDKLLDRAIDFNPDNIEYYLAKAAILEKQSNWGEVVALCDQMMMLDTRDIRPLEIKGNAFYQLARLDEAEAMFSQVLSRAPSRLVTRLMLARVAMRKSSPQKALAILDEIIASGVHILTPYVERAQVRWILKMYEEAMEDVYYALGFEVDNPAALLLLSKLQAQMKNHRDFYLNFEKVLQQLHKLNVPIQYELKSDPVFKPYLKDERFQNLLERYDIILLPDINRADNNTDKTSITKS